MEELPPAGRERERAGHPLANRDFRLLFAGRSVSLLGDGALLVALAWEAYTISGGPTALAILGIAMTLPLLLLLLLGGVASDRLERRRVMIAADLTRAVLLTVLGALALSGRLRLWEMGVAVALFGCAQAFFDPASDAILPEILPEEQLAAGNALEEVARPLALRLTGPALGGLLVASLGSGAVFIADGATFVVSALALCAMTARLPRACAPRRERGAASVTRELTEGWRFVRGHAWLWGTFLSAGIAYLLFMGPSEVLLPFMVKHELGGHGLQLGLVLGAGGLGSILCAAAFARHALPRQGIVFIYGAWTLATLFVAGYGVARSMPALMLASLAFNALETAGTITWMTMKQRHVPRALLGRVSSLDWLISTALLPLSFALTAPMNALIGARATLIWAGCMGAVATVGGLMIPGVTGGPSRRTQGTALAPGIDRQVGV